MINNETIFKMYEIAKKIKNLGILSCNETNKNTHSLSQNIFDYNEVDNVKGFVMLINNTNCKISNYFDDNFFLYLEEIDLCKD